ncbi:MAG: glycoside hydrolase family 43 protein [Pseudomonadota bacterium]
MVENPILPGFNADPSFIRVGDDYYIAVSTFEWYPGVQIYHSTDLANWTLVSRPLKRAAQLDMRGNGDSCGIWAPCLSHADGKFWLVYTDVKRLDGAFKDTHNYIVCCDAIDGAWSDPWYVNSSGFDPSLFHDDDGRKWFMNMQWNHRGEGTGGNPAHASFDGVLLQEWSPEKGLLGPVKNIYTGTNKGLTEAPHIFKRNGWYYLTTAEGGTGYNHAVTLARSRDIWGPYEDHPDKYVITVDDPSHPIQRTGHGQYVEADDGTGWHTFLMGRPLYVDGKPYCQMGRESGLAKVVWQDDWMYLAGGGQMPPSQVDVGAEAAPRQDVVHARFDNLPSEFQWLRTPDKDRLFRLAEGQLILTGRESIGSHFEQSLVARRQEDWAYDAETSVDFAPDAYQQAAGLITYYNRHKFHGVLVTNEGGQRVLSTMSCNGDWPECGMQVTAGVPVQDGPIDLRVEVRGPTQQFSWFQGGAWQAVGPAFDAYQISDEGGRGEHASFTGAFVGMIAFDLTGKAKEAAFSRFAYRPQPFAP